MNIYKNIISSICIVLLLAPTFGKQKYLNESQGFAAKSAATRPEKAFYNHTTNNNWMAATNYGSYGDPNSSSTGRPSAQWPGGSGNNYLYDAGL